MEGGDYYDAEPSDSPHESLALARMVSQITFRSDDVFTDRFGREVVDPIEVLDGQRFEVERYLEYHGDKLVRRFDANTYLLLSKAMDLHDLARGRGGMDAALGRARARILALGITSDILYPRYQSKEVVDAVRAVGGRADYAEIESDHGHDAFLLEDEVGAVLADLLDACGEGGEERLDDPAASDQGDHCGTAGLGRLGYAPVLFPSTTYEVGSVDDHRRLAGSTHPDRYYSRFGSPTVGDFEAAVAELEGADAALAFSSGMAAVTAVVFGLCSTGDHVVAQRQVFSVTSALFTMHCPRFGIDVTFVDGTDLRRDRRRGAAGAHAARVRRDAGQPTTRSRRPRCGGRHLRPHHRGRLDLLRPPSSVRSATVSTSSSTPPRGIGGHNDALLGVIAGRATSSTPSQVSMLSRADRRHRSTP